MATRRRPSGARRTSTTSTQTTEAQLHLRLSPVDPGISKALQALPNAKERLQTPADLLPKPQRSTNQKVESDTQQLLDGHDLKYNLQFTLKALNGFPNVHNYIRRDKEIGDLDGFLDQEPTDVRKTVFFVGNSGFGKTQLATTYAQESKHKYSATFFVVATAKSTLNQSFAFILREQLWDNWPDIDIDRPKIPPSDDQTVRKLVHQWLSQPRNKKWLLIFDDASDPDLLLPYLPSKFVDHGTVIITAQPSAVTEADFREKNIPGQSRQINVDGLQYEDGEKLLRDIAGDAYQETETSEETICVFIEHLC
jgi:NB-ARC domain